MAGNFVRLPGQADLYFLSLGLGMDRDVGALGGPVESRLGYV